MTTKLKLVKPILSKDYYVYILYDIDEITPIYVGKGKADRWLEHEKIALVGKYTQHNPRLYRRILRIINQNGYLYKIKALENVTDKEAIELEIRLIAQFGRADKGLGTLLNLTDGGEGHGGFIKPENVKQQVSKAMKGRPRGPMSNETKEKLRLANTGKKQTREQVEKRSWWRPSKEHRESLSRKFKGRPGKIPTEETRRKQSESHKGIPLSKGARQKLIGRKHSEETKEKMRISHILSPYKHSEEVLEKLRSYRHTIDTKNRISNSKRGHVVSEDTRQKISETLKRKAKMKETVEHGTEAD